MAKIFDLQTLTQSGGSEHVHYANEPSVPADHLTRVYFGPRQVIGLACHTSHGGDVIREASLDGQFILHSEAKKILSELPTRVYYDRATGTVHTYDDGTPVMRERVKRALLDRLQRTDDVRVRHEAWLAVHGVGREGVANAAGVA